MDVFAKQIVNNLKPFEGLLTFFQRANFLGEKDTLVAAAKVVLKIFH